MNAPGVPRVVIVTGSRTWTDEPLIRRVLDHMHPACVVQGGARGADRMAAKWAMEQDISCITYYAKWSLHGRRAGLVRNELMLTDLPTACVVAFYLGTPGTRHMIDRAKLLGRELHIYQPGQQMQIFNEGKAA